MHALAGTRVHLSDDQETYAQEMHFLRRFMVVWEDKESVADRQHLHARRLAYTDWRLKWGKFKLAALIAIAGAIISLAVPQLWQMFMAKL